MRNVRTGHLCGAAERLGCLCGLPCEYVERRVGRGDVVVVCALPAGHVKQCNTSNNPRHVPLPGQQLRAAARRRVRGLPGREDKQRSGCNNHRCVLVPRQQLRDINRKRMCCLSKWYD